MYQLKPGQETIQVVDGPMAGTTYHRGLRYATIPENERHRFETVKQPVAGPKKESTPLGGEIGAVSMGAGLKSKTGEKSK